MYWLYLIYILAAWFAAWFVYAWLTRFTKVITVANKDVYSEGQGRSFVARNSIADEKGNVYRVANAWPMLEFRSAEALLAIKVQETYRVHGYGIRIPILGMFPTVYKVQKA